MLGAKQGLEQIFGGQQEKPMCVACIYLHLL